MSRSADDAGWVAGIDAGMETVKAVVLAGDGRLASAILPGGTAPTALVAKSAVDGAARRAGIQAGEIGRIVVTGSGAGHIPWGGSMQPEPLCLSRGIDRLLPSTKTLLDLGARKSLALRCEAGRLVKVAASGKCAAGTGTYLRMVAALLGIDMAAAGDLYFRSASRLEIQSPCAVFAESEIISRIHGGEPIEDIVRGIFTGLAGRLYSQLLDVGIEREVAVVGGLARSRAMTAALEELLGFSLVIPDTPEIVGALGAALCAMGEGGVVS